MEVWCPYCNAKSEIDEEQLENHYNDWFEDYECPQCGDPFDMFIELEPMAVTYPRRYFKCAECGKQAKHIKLRRNPYTEDNKKFCEECFNKNIVKWTEKFRADAEEAKKSVQKRGRPKKGLKTT